MSTISETTSVCMRDIQTLPDEVLQHIVSFILCELRKLPLVCIRFREICMMPHWYTKFMLVLNPTQFTAKSILDKATYTNPLCFQTGNTQQLIVHDPHLFASYYQSSNASSPRLISLPWQHFSAFDLHLTPKHHNHELRRCLDIIVPHFSSIEITPTSKKQADDIYIDEKLFGNKLYKDVHHLCLNGKVSYLPSTSDCKNTSSMTRSPSIHGIFRHIFPNIQYLELNYVCYPQCDWLNETIDALPQLVILDLWKCKWQPHSMLVLSRNVELFRVFGCTLQTAFDFSRCKNNIRVISTDCSHCLSSKNLLRQIAGILSEYDNKDKLEIILAHIRDTAKCIKVLKQMLYLNITRLHIVYTRDMYKILDDLQEKVKSVFDSNKYDDEEHDEERDNDDDDPHDLLGLRPRKKKRKHKKFQILQQHLSFNFEECDDDEFAVYGTDDLEKASNGSQVALQQQQHAQKYEDEKQQNEKFMNIIYGKLNVNLFAASKNYALFRKLHKTGRLRGTFLWQQY